MHVVCVYVCGMCVFGSGVQRYALEKQGELLLNFFFYSSPMLECQNVVGCFILLGGGGVTQLPNKSDMLSYCYL